MKSDEFHGDVINLMKTLRESLDDVDNIESKNRLYSALSAVEAWYYYAHDPYGRLWDVNLADAYDYEEESYAP